MVKLSIEDVFDVIEKEGFGYAIQCYLSADRIEDERLKQLWSEAKERLDEIERIIGS